MGTYDHLIDFDRYRYPERTPVIAADIERAITDTVTLPSPVSFGTDGVLLELDGPTDAPILEVGVTLDRFSLLDWRDNVLLATQAVRAAPVKLGSQVYQVVRVPDDVRRQGYDSIHLRPDTGGSYTLTFSDLIPTAQDPLAGYAETLHPEQLMELYLYEFYRASRIERTAWLAQLNPAIGQLTYDDRQRIADAKMIDLLLVPDPNLYAQVLANLPAHIPISDATGNPVLRYLGAEVIPFEPEDDATGVRLKIPFEVIGRLDEEYSIWYFIDAIDSDGQWMVYDKFPDPPVTDWTVGSVHLFEDSILLEPGLYDISFGFWTRDRRRLYIDQANDVYSILIGRYSVPDRAQD